SRRIDGKLSPSSGFASPGRTSLIAAKGAQKQAGGAGHADPTIGQANSPNCKFWWREQNGWVRGCVLIGCADFAGSSNLGLGREHLNLAPSPRSHLDLMRVSFDGRFCVPSRPATPANC